MMEQPKDPQNVDKKPRTLDVKTKEIVDFQSLMLSEPVLAGLKQAGFERPSPIQLKAIPLGRCGLDLIVQAKSGTGKTCVFAVISLESLVLDCSSVQVLVLTPTREIAVQVWEVLNTLGSKIQDLRCYTFIGGMPVADDLNKLKKCHIAVGTPGRVKQLIEMQALNTESVRLFVLDEADKLLEQGFQESINWIYSSLPENKQMLALSATYPEKLAQHLTSYMRNPTFVRLNALDPALLGIRQYYKTVPFHPLPQKAFENKCQALTQLLTTVSFQQCLVFSNYQLRAESLSDILNSKGWPAAYISGSQDQQHRLTAMAKLKKFKCRVLISTDLTSRGIDAENVDLVVNLDIPHDFETYLHRIGRAGRFGSYGAAVTFASMGKEKADLKTIERKVSTKIVTLPDPVPSDLTRSSGYVDLEDYVTTEHVNNDSTNIHDTQSQDDNVTKSQEATTSNGQDSRNSDRTTGTDVKSGVDQCEDDQNGEITNDLINNKQCSTPQQLHGSDDHLSNNNTGSTSEVESQQSNYSEGIQEVHAQKSCPVKSDSIPGLIDRISMNVHSGFLEVDSLLKGALSENIGNQLLVDQSSEIDHSVKTANERKQEDPGKLSSLECQEDIQSKPMSDTNKLNQILDHEIGTHCPQNIIQKVSHSKKQLPVEDLKDILKLQIKPANIPSDVSAADFQMLRRCTQHSGHSTSIVEYENIMADLKHFRETGKFLIEPVQKQNESSEIDKKTDLFEESVKHVEKFLAALKIDPVKDNEHPKPKSSHSGQDCLGNNNASKKDSDENLTKFHQSPGEISSTDTCTSLSSVNISATAHEKYLSAPHRSHPSIHSSNQPRNDFKGARPKDAKRPQDANQKRTKPDPNVSKSKVNAELGRQKFRPKGKTSNQLDEDNKLGLEYMKKLTACADKPTVESASSSEITDESDTTESNSFSSEEIFDDDLTDDEWVEEEEGYEDDYEYGNQEPDEEKEKIDENYRQAKWASAESTYYKATEHHDQYEFAGDGDHQDWYGNDDERCNQEWEDNIHPEHQYNLYDKIPNNIDNNYWNPQHENQEQDYRYDIPPSAAHEYGVPMHMPYPHHLWMQYIMIMNNMMTWQASQYAWYCQQQYTYHIQQAEYYQQIQSQPNRNKSLRKEFERQKQVIKKMTKQYRR